MPRYTYDASGNVAMRTVAGALAPNITGQPTSRVAAPSETVTFSVVVSDAQAVTFQWKFNGADIPGATGDSLLLTSVNAASEGQYAVVVTNSTGSVASVPAALLLDIDRDELPDSWEIGHFGSTDSQRSAGDPDGDGISNLEEFVDGSDPNVKGSLRPRLTAFSGAGGSVTLAPMKLSYALGETVALTAVPAGPGMFAGWSGDVNGTDNPATLKMNGNRTVRARFAAAVRIPLGLIATWRGETDARDLIGGHDGTFFAGAVPTAPRVTASGKVGGAFDLDGTVHVRIPDAAALRPAQFTAEAWVFPTSQDLVPHTIIARGSVINTWVLRLFRNRPQFWSHGTQVLEVASAITRNEWTHLAITFDGTTKRIYVNGMEAASQNGLGALVYDAVAVPMTIGSDSETDEGSALFIGQLDEVALYDRALAADDVAGIFDADVLGKNFLQPYVTSPSQLPDAVLGTNYSRQITAILGLPNILFSLSEGRLPPGLTLSSTGLVSGTPSATGTFSFTAHATDAAGTVTRQRCMVNVVS